MMEELPSEVEQYYYRNKFPISRFRSFENNIVPSIIVYHSDHKWDRWAIRSGQWKLIRQDEIALSDDDVRSDKITIVRFRYWRGNDEEPRIIYLGTRENPDKNLVCGINLNYLEAQQERILKSIMGYVLGEADTVSRVRSLRAFLLGGEIFEIAYRTYEERYVHVLEITEEDITDDPLF